MILSFSLHISSYLMVKKFMVSFYLCYDEQRHTFIDFIYLSLFIVTISIATTICIAFYITFSLFYILFFLGCFYITNIY